jgi:hypothetical protein
MKPFLKETLIGIPSLSRPEYINKENHVVG